jgi:uncharacterized repeat protein (TIGR02543 family)
MKKVFGLLAAFLLAASLTLVPQAAQAETPSVDYKAVLTDAAGNPVSDLQALNAGDTVKLDLVMSRSDLEQGSQYGVWGLEYWIRTTGLTYMGDGQRASELGDTTLYTHDYKTYFEVGFAQLDTNRKGWMVPNPFTVASWTYTVTDPAAADLKVQVANIYLTGETKGSETRSEGTLSLDPAGGSLQDSDISGTYETGKSLTLPRITRQGYTFKGWQAADGSLYEAGSAYTIAAGDVTLTAAWAKKTSGGGGGGVTPKPTPTPDPTPTPSDRPLPHYLHTGGAHTAYIVGMPDGSFGVASPLTRGQIAAIFDRLLEDDVRAAHASAALNYSDVSLEDWFGPSIAILSDMGILAGYPDGSFRPNAPVSRAELAALCSRFFDKPASGKDISFNDIDGHWAREVILTSARLGLVGGYPDGSFRPDRSITRSEAVSLLNRVLGRTDEGTMTQQKKAIAFSDNLDSGKWYYGAIQEAANDHARA